MSPRPRSGYRRPTLNANELHRRWLQLVDSDGPFLSIPVLKRVYPQGITTLSAGLVSELKVAKPVFEKAWDNFHTGDLPLEDYRTARDTWVEVVLRRLCGWGGDGVAFVDDDLAVLFQDRRVTCAAGEGL